MLLNNRHGSVDSDAYRYGFNGKEKDDEVKGGGAQYDYGFRIYDPRLAKFLSIDPLFQSFPYFTPYQYAGNMPIWAKDLDGLEQLVTNQVRLTVKTTIYDTNNNIVENANVTYYNRQGELVREKISSGIEIRSEGYEGGPVLTVTRQFRMADRLAPSPNKDYQRLYILEHDYVETTPATKSPPVEKKIPSPPYEPKSNETPSPEKPVLKTTKKERVEKKIPKIKSGTSQSLLEGVFFPTIDEDGIDFVSFTDGSFPGKNKLQSLVNSLNASPEIKTVTISGAISRGNGESEFKVKNAIILGIDKLKRILKEMGLRKNIELKTDRKNIESPNTDQGGEAKAQINLKFD